MIKSIEVNRTERGEITKKEDKWRKQKKPGRKRGTEGETETSKEKKRKGKNKKVKRSTSKDMTNGRRETYHGGKE